MLLLDILEKIDMSAITSIFYRDGRKVDLKQIKKLNILIYF